MPGGHRVPREAVVSVLFPAPGLWRADPVGDPRAPARAAPEHFSDLNIDQIVAALTAGREEYELDELYSMPLDDPSAVSYRHEVFRDLQRPDLRACVEAFAAAQREMRANLAQAGKLHYERQSQRWFLAAASAYCHGVDGLAESLARIDLGSSGMSALREHLSAYSTSDHFTALHGAVAEVERRLSEVVYTLAIKGNRITVETYSDESDYSAEVAAAFERFIQAGDGAGDPAKSHQVRFRERAEMDHVEGGVLEIVAGLFPEAFSSLEAFCEEHDGFLDATLRRFDREVQFYLAYLDHVGRVEQGGLRFCYPTVTIHPQEIFARDAFDLALAAKLVAEDRPVVCNDFSLVGPERILVVTGPNQGGKTTFARAFGQLHYLAGLGCPVPASEARLCLADRIYSHFERSESLEDERGKLQEELVRVHDILSTATSRSVVIMNETFASATLHDARYLGSEVLRRLMEIGSPSVCVTFVEELASLGEATVSMVSAVDPADPTTRTYKVLRRPADGLAYALAIAGKHGLTYERLKDRLGSRELAS